MWIAERCQNLGEVDTHELTDAIAQQPRKLWDAEEHIKHKIADHRQTQSLILQIITDQAFIDIIRLRPLKQNDVPRYSAWKKLNNVVQPILNNALSYFPEGGIVLRVQIAQMLPGTKVEEHIESSVLLASSNRIHIPLKTNKEVYFVVDGKRIFMKQGFLYNLNTRVPHWVENRSSETRLHLIIDYLPPDNNSANILNLNFDLTLKERYSKTKKSNLPLPRKDIPLPTILATSVIRGAHQNQSHGGIYLVEMESGNVKQVVDWNSCDIDFSGRGWDRGLRGICFYKNNIYIAASNELYCFDKDFKITNSFRNSYLQHAHEIVTYNDYLYITSTGFDSVLRFDLKTNIFDKGWLTRRSRNGQLEIKQFIPQEPYGPQPGNTLHINNVTIDNKGLHISGRNADFILQLNQGTLNKSKSIPLGTHNVMSYADGLLFNDTSSDQIVFTSTYNYFSIPVPVYPQKLLLNTELGDEKLARQAFGRGLCEYKHDIVFAGSSPSTISAYDLQAQKLIKSVNISMDIRNAIHGLEIWPF